MKVTATHIIKIEGIDNVLYQTETGYFVGANVIGISAEEAAKHMGVVLAQPKYKLNYDTFKTALGIAKLEQVQVDSIEAILAECANESVTIKEQVAYILATAWHESYLKPIQEMGGEAYLKSKRYFPYFGRGFVQLTWGSNYKKQGDRLGIDLETNPDKVLEIPVAANILVYGMEQGEFTGKKLSQYITAEKQDYINARRIVNGTDKSQLISGYAVKILNCLS